MKYLYIDTNQFRHLYSQNEGFSEEIHTLICKLIDNDHGCLLMPQQTDDEIQRNRLRVWPDQQKKSLEAEISKIKTKAASVRADFAEYPKFVNLAAQIEAHAVKVEKGVEKELQHFTKKTSSPNKKLFDLLERADSIPETDTVYVRAERRMKKGNPPYDTKIGDHLIWESLIERLAAESKPELIFVGNDSNAWGKNGPDPWLVDEFKRRTSGKVMFVKRLSDIPGLTTAEQAKIKQAEDRNVLDNTLTDFINSPSFIDAGEFAKRLLKFKDRLDETDIMRVFDAARTNFEIYRSFFTTEPLRRILGDGQFVHPSLETVDNNLWQDFEEKNSTGLKRQSDQTVGEQPINLDDIQF